MDRAFKDSVERRMAERNMSRAQFAQALGVTRGAITQFFGEQESSTLVPAICALLDLPRPGVSDDELALLVASLDDEQRRVMLDLARQLASKPKRKPD